MKKDRRLTRRVLSFIMALTVILALMPATVFAADAGTTVYLVPNANWKEASARFAVYYYTSDTDNGWVSMTVADEDGYYEAVVPAGYSNIIFCRMNPDTTDNNWNNKWNQTADLTIPTDGTNCYTVADGTWDQGGGTWSTYTPAGGEGGGAIDTSEPVTWATIHYRNTGLWSDVYYHAWIENGDNDTALTTWPGTVLTEETDHKNWYTLTLEDLEAANGIGVIFNDNNNGSQTGDIMITANGEYWYDGELLTEAPDSWDDGSVATAKYSTTLHFANTLNWGSVNLYTWTATGTPTGSWPGTKAGLDADGFYSMSFTYEAPEGQGLNFIFSGGGQTVDLALNADDFTKGEDDVYTAEKWVVPTTQDSEGKYYADIVDNPEAIVISPVVDGNSVTFEYKDEYAQSVVVKGTMSNDNWATAYTMTRNDYGVWSVTIENVSYGIHEYKFVVNYEGDSEDHWETDDANTWQRNGNSAFLISNPNLDDNEVTINVHYDAPSTEWNVCAWGAPNLASQYDFTDDVATITLDGRASQYVCFKVRKSIEGNDWAEQSGEIRVDLANIVSGTIDVYVGSDFSVSQSLNDDVVTTNKVSSVELDYDNNTIIIQTTKMVSDTNTAFSIYKNGGQANIIESVSASGSTYTLTLTETLSLTELYQYKVRFSEQAKFTDYDYDIGITTVYASDKFADEFTYTGTDLGATWSEDATTFKVWAPTASDVSVKLYATGSDDEENAESKGTHAMKLGEKGVWTATVEGDLNRTYYTYAVTVNGEPPVEAVDPYARTTGVNGKRGMVIDLDSTDPTDWATDKDPNPLESYTDAIIYELHVRDFSIDDSSGVKDEWQGKFLGLTQSGTKSTDGTTVTGLDYLKSMGFTHLHLLPVYDYGSVDETKCENFNWGYDPVNYNVPEGSYSTDPYNGEVRVEEFKEMVSTLHDNDISVIMDVVYNHVYDAGLFCMNQIVPGYFSRQNSDGSYSNGSGCGNDTASEREMVRKYIVDSVNYWADEYHVDGFRFDLVGLLDATTINEIVDTVHENHPGALFYGEGWTLGTAVEPGNTMATQANSSATPEFAYFSDTIRNLLAGQNGTSKGYVSGLTGQEEAVANNFMANPGWTSNPTQIIQYASCHDNYTLVDKLVLSTGASGVTSDIIKMNNLAAAIYMTSQGIPFIHAGEEFLREKLEEDGTRCENSYNAPDSVNHIEWSNLEDETYATNSDYYKGLIAFRKAHESLRLATTAEVTANVKYSWITNEVVMFTIDAAAAGDISDSIVVIFNANSSAKTVTLPEGEWSVCINGTQAGTAPIGEPVSDSVSVDGISAMVLVQGKTEEEPVELFDLAGTTMTLGNSLQIDFAIDTAKLDGDGHYAVITKDYADSTSKTVTVNQADWKVYSGSVYYFSFTDVAAKEMCDQLTVNVYNAEGQKVTNEKTDSVKDYCLRMLAKEDAAETPKEELQTLFVDMLNYGAAAQEVFKYDTENLANSGLTEAQQAYATANVSVENILEQGTGYAGSTLTLECEILLDFVYHNDTISKASYAVATYTDHYGDAKTYRTNEFRAYGSTMTYVSVRGLAVADCSQPVTMTLYDANGNALSTTVDSVESYVARNASDSSDIYNAIMKFATSAYNYFH